MSSAGRAANSSGCVARPRAREIGLIGFAAQIRRSLLTGSYVMETAEHREPCESRGSRTVLGAPGGEIPPGDSTCRFLLDVATFKDVARGDGLPEPRPRAQSVYTGDSTTSWSRRRKASLSQVLLCSFTDCLHAFRQGSGEAGLSRKAHSASLRRLSPWSR